jgi:glycosyltransferase involved in cell wall biosynthesis
MDILPTVITEAMAARLPVVSTRLAGIPEMVLDGKTGRLVAPGDAAAIASAVRGLLSQPDQARSMGEAGRRHAEEMFSEGVTIPQLVALLQSMNATPVQALA